MNEIPILILHGWNLSADKFISLQNELKKRGYKVLTPDLPGFGNSKSPNHPLTLTDYANFAEEFVLKNKLGKIILIGHSFGGRISIKLAAEKQELVHAVILTGAPGINPVPRVKVAFFIFLAKLGRKILSLPIINIFQNKAKHLLYRAAQATDFYNTDEKMRDTFKNIVKENLVPFLSQINIPTLLLWGREDKIVPVNIAQRMQKLIKNSSLVSIEKARHGVPWTHAGIFADEVNKFLQKL